MSKRHFADWLSAYIGYAAFSEAPRHMHFWAGVSTIAGALQRKVWLDMAYFKWHVNHYIIFVAPPGIVSKSTTVAISLNLLRKIPGIQFGPDVVTWPALVTAFAQSNKQFIYNGEYLTQCALTLESSEFGNLLNPQDREMVDLLVTLWDSKQGGFTKVTKTSGNDVVENPWINLIACTTPSWIAGNFPEYMIGGGFTSRCLFVYTERKEKLVAYPSLHIPSGIKEVEKLLVEDLEHIAENLVGSYVLTQDAITWGTEWYESHYKNPNETLNDDRFSGYLARKQTHIHKLAMVLSASQRDEMTVTADDLALANKMITDLEVDMPKVFSRIGRTEESIQAERFVSIIHRYGKLPYSDAYRLVHLHFPNMRDFEGILNGAIRAGLIRQVQDPLKGVCLEAIKRD
jgi:hypothetical protein